MKIYRSLSVAAVATALLFGATACGNSTPVPETAPSVQSESSAAASSSSPEEVAETVERYYSTISDMEKLQPLIDASQTLAPDVTDEEASKVVTEAAPEIFGMFDIDTTEDVKNAYAFIQMSSMFPTMSENMKFEVPVSAVTLDGDTAKYDGTKTGVIVDGEAQDIPEAEPSEDTTMNLVKKDGEWLIVPPTIM